MECCQKREETLINEESTGKYNRYFDRMRVYARKLIDENRQDELLLYMVKLDALDALKYGIPKDYP